MEYRPQHIGHGEDDSLVGDVWQGGPAHAATAPWRGNRNLNTVETCRCGRNPVPHSPKQKLQHPTLLCDTAGPLRMLSEPQVWSHSGRSRDVCGQVFAE